MAAPPADEALHRVRGVTGQVVALALVLIAAQEVLLVMRAAVGGELTGPGPVLADLAQKVPWGVGVCTGLWLGLELGHRRPLGVALAGLISAPIASLLLRGVAEGAHALAFTEAPSGPSPFTVAAVRGVEYSCLGLLVAWLDRRAWARAPHYAAAGMAVGIPFGLTLLGLSAGIEGPPLSGRMFAWAVNEVMFPLGCALILFRATRAER